MSNIQYQAHSNQTLSLLKNPILWLYSIIAGICIFLWFINHEFFHYFIGSYHNNCQTFFYLMIAANLTLLIAAKYIEQEIPKLSLVLGSISQSFLFLAAFSLMWPILITTPFTLHDKFFFQFDLNFHYDIGSIYLWSLQHHLVEKSLSFWRTMDVALLLIPVLLAIFTDKRNVRIYYSMLLISAVIGGILYYFFPTTDPANAIASINFPHLQYAVVDRFHTIHQHAIYADYRTGGIASFPSFHTVWAITFIYCCRNNKWLRYPVLAYGLLIILSTIFSGWHFLSDIAAGILVAYCSAVIAERLFPKTSTLPVESYSHWLHTFRDFFSKSKQLSNISITTTSY